MSPSYERKIMKRKTLIKTREDWLKLKSRYVTTNTGSHHDILLGNNARPKTYPCVAAIEYKFHMTMNSTIYFTFVYLKDFDA